MSQNVADVSDSLKRFDVIDYTVFIFMLVLCSFIGLFFGYEDHRKQKARRGSGWVEEYLLGGRNVQVFPGKV